jgi:nitrite reductase/ring-hydroxylating ferredoxin subunit
MTDTWSGRSWPTRLARRWPSRWPVQLTPRKPWDQQEPTYRAAAPALIEGAVKRATVRPTGNWFVFAASRQVRGDRPLGANVAGVELVAWRLDDGTLRVGPGACPHLGAPLALARVERGRLICRWHGLAIGGRDSADRSGWCAYPGHDDGVLCWVRLDRIGGEDPLPTPLVPRRPTGNTIDAVASMVGCCEPVDIVANRLDPWHGAWFHPYSFSDLEVLSAPRDLDVPDEDDRFVVNVTFRLGGALGVPVRAEFNCPDARTVVMRIVDGEGLGTVVETHATPLTPASDGMPRTAVIEATLAASDRAGFRLAQAAGGALRPAMRWAAARLWKDDLAYAERRFELRNRGA